MECLGQGVCCGVMVWEGGFEVGWVGCEGFWRLRGIGAGVAMRGGVGGEGMLSWDGWEWLFGK